LLPTSTMDMDIGHVFCFAFIVEIITRQLINSISKKLVGLIWYLKVFFEMIMI